MCEDDASEASASCVIYMAGKISALRRTSRLKENAEGLQDGEVVKGTTEKADREKAEMKEASGERPLGLEHVGAPALRRDP